VLRRVAAGLDPNRYNGACMVGLAGIVVKSHGRADGVAFSRAIATAAVAARRGLTAHIAQALAADGLTAHDGIVTQPAKVAPFAGGNGTVV
jgi:phosphate acyltransferase